MTMVAKLKGKRRLSRTTFRTSREIDFISERKLVTQTLLARLATHYGAEPSKLAEVLMGDVLTDLELLRHLPTARVLAWMHGTLLAKLRRCREDDR